MLFKYLLTFYFLSFPHYIRTCYLCLGWMTPNAFSFQLFSFIITWILLIALTQSAALIPFFCYPFVSASKHHIVSSITELIMPFHYRLCLILSVNSCIIILHNKKFLCLTDFFSSSFFFHKVIQTEDLLICIKHLSLVLISLLTYYLTLRNKLILMDSHCSLLPCRWPLRGCEIKFFMQLSNE